MARGLIGEPFRPDMGRKPFYFRVSYPDHTFDIMVQGQRSVTEQYALSITLDTVKKLYPGSRVTVLLEKFFAADGLPVVRVRQHRAIGG